MSRTESSKQGQPGGGWPACARCEQFQRALDAAQSGLQAAPTGGTSMASAPCWRRGMSAKPYAGTCYRASNWHYLGQTQAPHGHHARQDAQGSLRVPAAARLAGDSARTPTPCQLPLDDRLIGLPTSGSPGLFRPGFFAYVPRARRSAALEPTLGGTSPSIAVPYGPRARPRWLMPPVSLLSRHVRVTPNSGALLDLEAEIQLPFTKSPSLNDRVGRTGSISAHSETPK